MSPCGVCGCAIVETKEQVRLECEHHPAQLCVAEDSLAGETIVALRADLARLRAELEAADDCIASHEGLRTAIVTLTAERDKWKAYAEDREKMDDALSEGQFELRDQLAALRVREGQLREALELLSRAEPVCDDDDATLLEARRRAQLALSSPPDAPDVLEAIRVATGRAKHDNNCRVVIRWNGECDCGLAAALATLRAAGVVE